MNKQPKSILTIVVEYDGFPDQGSLQDSIESLRSDAKVVSAILKVTTPAEIDILRDWGV